jgi:hypothetical protein
MTARHDAAGHLTSAAFHHKQAARFHREASRHHEIGKDYAHAAHQALVAHGHGLRAIDYGNDAGTYFAEHDRKALPKYPEAVPRFPLKSLEPKGTIRADLSGAEHHTAAADHHEQAARHHGQASKHYDAKEYMQAAHEMQIAQGHAQHSVFHGDEAAKHHVEHFGKSGPTAELS